MALQNYHDTHQAFPARSYGIAGAGNGTNTGNRERLSTNVAVLPFMELTSLYQGVQNFSPHSI